ncbi:MAG TPA: SDR family oxidoreductase [Azospirillaceae bacterium]|nr:SDR family oxidoreductase [Azospirillaceae bacterium]
MPAPIVVIGATGGVGEALARRLAKAGRPLHLVARSSDRLGPLASSLGTGQAVADVTDTVALERAVTAGDMGDGIAGLVYAVGTITIHPLKHVSADELVQDFRLNLVGAAMAVKAAESALRQAKGSVVLFSTVAVRQGFANHAVIASAKGAVEGLMVSLAAELAPDVRVNCIAPGLTRTPLAAQLTRSEQMVHAIAGLHAIPRLGEADDLAAAAEFLLSDQAGWITGQVLGVDGGRSTLRTKG